MGTLANPTVEVNDVVIAIRPNSLKYKKGKGDRNARAQSAGGDSVDIVVTEDADTKKSMCGFTLILTKSADDLIDAWIANFDQNTVRLSEGDFVLSFRQMTILSEPERAPGSDGEVEITFEGKAVE